MATQEEKTSSLLVWLLSIFIGIISPVIFMLVGKDKPVVYANAMQNLTFQLFMIVAWIAVFAIALVTVGIGLILYPVLWVFGLVICIMGIMKAKDGEVYEPPITGPLAKKWFNV